MRILHLIATLEGGGAERQLAMLASEQSNQGMETHIGLTRGGVNQNVLESSDVALHWLGSRRSSVSTLFNIGSLVRRLTPDLIQTWLPQMDVLGGWTAIRNRVPWVISERTDKSFYVGFRMDLWLRSKLAHYASAVVSNSEGGMKYWQSSKDSRRQLFQIPNAVDIRAIQRSMNRVCESQSLNQPRYSTILVVGRLQRSKGVEEIIKAVANFDNRFSYRVVIIGDGPMHGELRALIRDLNLGERVSLHPYQHDWWQLFSQADLLVSMSRFEGQPNVVLEAMAAQCPLVVSDIPAHRELLDEHSAVLVPVTRTEELSDAIASVLSNTEAARERAGRAFKIVEKRTIQSIAKSYQDVYGTLLQRSGS